MNLITAVRRIWSFLKETVFAPVVVQFCLVYCLLQRRLYRNPSSWRREWREELLKDVSRRSTLGGASRDIPRLNVAIASPPHCSLEEPGELQISSHPRDFFADGGVGEVDVSPESCRVRCEQIVTTLVSLAHVCKATVLAEGLRRWWIAFSSDDSNQRIIEQPDASIWVKSMLQQLFPELPPKEADSRLFFALLGLLSQGTVFPAVQHVYNILWAPHVKRMTDMSWIVFVDEHPRDKSLITIIHRLVTRCESSFLLSLQWDMKIEINRDTALIQSCALTANHLMPQDVQEQSDGLVYATLWKLRVNAMQARLRML